MAEEGDPAEARFAPRLLAALALALALGGCGQKQAGTIAASVPAAAPAIAAGGAPAAGSVSMGRAKSVTTFFVTSVGLGDGGNLGGLAGADAHCQALATAQGSGDHTWRAYLSAAATATSLAVNARDRIGNGPWHNADGMLVANTLDDLHGAASRLGADTAEGEDANPVSTEDGPNRHAVLTGAQADGTAFGGKDDRTCSNWTSNGAGHAEVGYSDRAGGASWNAATTTQSCSEAAFTAAGGAGLFYCFAIN